MKTYNYGTAILAAFEYLLDKYPEVFVIGQGLWSPWYVGNSMTDLDKKYGVQRIIDTPVSESACTGAAVGASLSGMRPIVVHPRIDFMLYAMDAVVNQAAKWSHMVGGQTHPAVTIRGIINRGGEQGAQHSQALHSWFAHIPGLRVVMPSTVADARDLLIASVLCNDPVMYIDDRWLYSQTDDLPDVEEIDLRTVGPRCLAAGTDLSIVASGYSTLLAMNARHQLAAQGVSVEIVDLRVLNPFDPAPVVESVRKTGRMLAVDGSWRTCGMSAEVIASVVERLAPGELRAAPRRITLPDAPAPTSRVLEKIYYPDVDQVVLAAQALMAR
ncbi:MAG: alpha-ketoacid dehydrogenase subunit beta [Gammaproteobacteria bacterium]|nr:alpha-ketoacid dehydrogenase subunit beta [Gammaproteobacteria bacterium]MBM4234407.1 alpha-ketoacid dehydrogenase subunit beta [Gammaproteobacteria bacterium]